MDPLSIIIGAMVWSLIFTKVIRDGRTDHALAKRGKVSPRLAAKYGSPEAARSATGGYGLYGFLHAAWMDYWPRRAEALIAGRDARAALPSEERPTWRSRWAGIAKAARAGARVIWEPRAVASERDAEEPVEAPEEQPPTPAVVPEMNTVQYIDGKRMRWNGIDWVPAELTAAKRPEPGPAPLNKECRVCGGVAAHTTDDHERFAATIQETLDRIDGQPATQGKECHLCGGPAAHTTEDHRPRLPDGVRSTAVAWPGDGEGDVPRREASERTFSWHCRWCGGGEDNVPRHEANFMAETHQDSCPNRPTTLTWKDRQTGPVVVDSTRSRRPTLADGQADAEQVDPTNPTPEPTTPGGTMAATGEASNYETAIVELNALADEQRTHLDQCTAAHDAVTNVTARIGDMQDSYRATAEAARLMFDSLAARHLPNAVLASAATTVDAMPAGVVADWYDHLEAIGQAVDEGVARAEAALAATEECAEQITALLGDAHETVASQLEGDASFLESGSGLTGPKGGLFSGPGSETRWGVAPSGPEQPQFLDEAHQNVATRAPASAS